MRKMREEFKHKFNGDMQRLILGRMISDPDIFARCRSIVRDEYFDDQLSSTARFILQHADEYRLIPDIALIHAKTGQQLAVLPTEEMQRQREWFLKEIEDFCRYRAMENSILDALDLLRNGEAGEVERRVKEAMTISLISDLGIDYFRDPASRLRDMEDRSAFVSTGWQVLDDELHRGFSRGDLNVFAGASGSGKSLVLQNLALNWALAGFLVIYFTLELSEKFVARRLDAMITGMSTKEIYRNISETDLLITMRAKKANRLFIKKMPEGSTTTNDLRGFLKEFEIQTGIKPDAIIVDYLDLMYPNDRRINPSDLFVKDKFVSEELRGLYQETNAFGASASQLNRGAIEAQGEYLQSHIAGGISKINTADNVIAIWVQKDRGEYEMVFLKTRSSAGVGHRIKLQYNRDSMRITDPEIPADQPRSYDDIKVDLQQRTTTVISEEHILKSKIGRRP